MLNGKARHAGGGSSREHASNAALQAGVYGGIDPLAPGDIGAAGLPTIAEEFDSGVNVPSNVFTEVVFSQATSNRTWPMNIFVTTGTTTTTVFIRFTFSDNSTLDSPQGTGIVTGLDYYLNWGAPTFAQDGDAWFNNASFTVQNLFTKLDQRHDGLSITRVSVFAKDTASAGSVTFHCDWMSL